MTVHCERAGAAVAAACGMTWKMMVASSGEHTHVCEALFSLAVWRCTACVEAMAPKPPAHLFLSLEQGAACGASVAVMHSRKEYFCNLFSASKNPDKITCKACRSQLDANLRDAERRATSATGTRVVATVDKPYVGPVTVSVGKARPDNLSGLRGTVTCRFRGCKEASHRNLMCSETEPWCRPHFLVWQRAEKYGDALSNPLHGRDLSPHLHVVVLRQPITPLPVDNDEDGTI